MPRKRSKKGKPVNATGVELKAVRLELPEETHRQLRVRAAEHGMSMASYVRQLVEDHLVKPTPKGKGGVR
jgi:predicted HicB family RNase H-like nuclease